MRHLSSQQEDEEGWRRRKRTHKQVRVGRTPVGKGVFAARNYRTGDLVGEIEGQVIEDPDYTSAYCFDLGDVGCLEPRPPFRFLNHRCDPNCYFEYFDVAAEGEKSASRRIFVMAVDEIYVGEELTIDYRWPAEMAIPCRCGSPECRGWVVSEEDLELLPARGLAASG